MTLDDETSFTFYDDRSSEGKRQSLCSRKTSHSFFLEQQSKSMEFYQTEETKRRRGYMNVWDGRSAETIVYKLASSVADGSSNGPGSSNSGETSNRDQHFSSFMSRRGYLDLENIGSGGFGSVYKAWHGTGNRFVAVKVIDKQLTHPSYMTDYYPVERAIWPRLSHPNLVKLYETSEDPRWIYFVMDWSEEGDILQWVDSGHPLKAHIIKRWAYQIGQGMAYLKRRGYVHGDIKLINVLVFDGNARLCDFGCMKKNTKKCELYCGTWGYMAPEVYYGIPHDSEKADVFSFGISIYRLFCYWKGKEPLMNPWYPRDNRDWQSVMPVGGRKVFRGMLALNEEDRFDLDDVLDSEWFEVCERTADRAEEQRRKREAKRGKIGKSSKGGRSRQGRAGERRRYRDAGSDQRSRSSRR